MNPLPLILIVFVIPCAVVVLAGLLHGKGKAEYLCGNCGAGFLAYPGDYRLQCPACWTVFK